MDIVTAKQRRFTLLKDNQRILDTVKADRRGLTKAEQTTLDKNLDELDELGPAITRLEQEDDRARNRAAHMPASRSLTHPAVAGAWPARWS